MADTGLLSPASTGEDFNQWTTPTNAFSSNNTYATETTDAQKQDYYDYGFSIPAGSTIDGIELQAELVAQLAEPGNVLFELSWNGGTTYTSSGFSTNIDSVEQVYTFGGATELWGRTWAQSEFSNANFRSRIEYLDIGFGARAALDHIQVKVYYTAPSSAGNDWPTFQSRGFRNWRYTS